MSAYKPVESVDRKRTAAIESLLDTYSLEKNQRGVYKS